MPNFVVMSHVLGYVMGSWRVPYLNIYSVTSVLLSHDSGYVMWSWRVRMYLIGLEDAIFFQYLTVPQDIPLTPHLGRLG